MIYSIFFFDPQAYKNERYGAAVPTSYEGRRVLEQLSTRTGGSVLQASAAHPVAELYERIEDELRKQYSLGYTPPKHKAGAGFHRIGVKVGSGEFEVRAREGYFSHE